MDEGGGEDGGCVMPKNGRVGWKEGNAKGALASVELGGGLREVQVSCNVGLTVSVADPDPGSGSFLTPRSGIEGPGWVKNQDPDPGSWILDEHPGTYFRELRNNFLG
jgi:hypothetical protein